MHKSVLFAVGLLTALAGCASGPRATNIDQASPHATWQGVVRALQIADYASLRRLTTDEGYSQLTRDRQGKRVPDKLVRVKGHAWGRFEARVYKQTDSTAVLHIGPDFRQHTITFYKLGSTWKLGSWVPAE